MKKTKFSTAGFVTASSDSPSIFLDTADAKPQSDFTKQHKNLLVLINLLERHKKWQNFCHFFMPPRNFVPMKKNTPRLYKFCENRRQNNRNQSGCCNGKTACGTFFFSHFHCFHRSNCMSRSSQRNPFCQRIFNF